MSADAAAISSSDRTLAISGDRPDDVPQLCGCTWWRRRVAAPPDHANSSSTAVHPPYEDLQFEDIPTAVGRELVDNQADGDDLPDTPAEFGRGC
ncbi:hypothetical protein ABZV93_00565 [Actinopolymorpha sp. NPDC004070]|uniref:hypothetical protein n=1 Tax=Actinopolymorpha sp. NPDC004070 TaxID=3154548 RepID=UPI0033A7B9AD